MGAESILPADVIERMDGMSTEDLTRMLLLGIGDLDLDGQAFVTVALIYGIRDRLHDRLGEYHDLEGSLWD